jgi:hypothetical protein
MRDAPIKNLDRRTFDARLASAFQGMEPEICDLKRMSKLLLDTSWSYLLDQPIADLTDEEVGCLVYATGLLHQQIEKLQADYYADFECAREAAHG